jgi:hypothetical protein
VDGQDEQWLLDPDHGFLDKEHQIFDAVVTWPLFDANGNFLLSEPLRLGPVSEPVPDNDPGWGHAETAIEIPYVLALNPPLQ